MLHAQSVVLLPTPTFQDIYIVISEKFNGSIKLVGLSLSSLLPQMKKQKERRYCKKPRFFILQHFKT